MDKIICINGFARVGKDTFFNLLKATNRIFVRFAFADELKHDLSQLILEQFGYDIFNLSEKQKEIIRPLLISYGCAWRKIDSLHWVKIVDKKIDKIIKNNNEKSLFNEDLYPKIIPCVTDCRFSNEILYFKNKYKDNFILVKIDRNGAPEPPEEEKINQPLVDKYVDFSISWETVGDKIELLRPYIDDFLNKYQL